MTPTQVIFGKGVRIFRVANLPSPIVYICRCKEKDYHRSGAYMSPKIMLRAYNSKSRRGGGI